MEKSKVYFTDFRTGLGVPLTAKLQKLIRLAGIGSIDFEGKFVAIKMHFGELGNLLMLSRRMADCRSLPTATRSIPEAASMRWSIWTAQI